MQALKVANSSRKYMPVIVNNCYGGFGFSKFAEKTISDRIAKQRAHKDADPVAKYNRLLIRAGVVNELGKKASSTYAQLEVFYYKIKYYGFVRIGEYDGLESAHVDIDAYKLEAIKMAADSSTLSASEIVDEVKSILQADYSDAKVFKTLPGGGVLASLMQ